MFLPSPLADRAFSPGFMALGLVVLLASPFLTRYHTQRRRFNARGARPMRLQLLYNGAASTLAGVLLSYGEEIGGRLPLIGVPLLGLTAGAVATPLRTP